MATSINPTTATTNEVSNQSATAKAVKTKRVLETRDQWTVIFNHTVTLVATLAKGDALPKDARNGFAFGKCDEQPHSRQYAQSLIGGFVSKKAGKVLAQSERLKDQADRQKIAIAILVATKLGGGDASRAQGILSKAEPKQAKAFAEAVLIELNRPTEAAKPSSKGKGTRKK